MVHDPLKDQREPNQQPIIETTSDWNIMPTQ